MPTVDVKDKNGEKVSEVTLADEIFAVEVKPEVLHEVVVMQLAKRRSGTACVKNRSDVAGSTRKLYRQKGTGRARRGNIKSPLLRGGGVVFGPHPRSYAYKVPKKVRRKALAMALSSKLAENKLSVVKALDLGEIKTRAFVKVVEKLGLSKPLIVISEKDEHLELSARNVPGVKILRSAGLNVYDILKHDDLVLLSPVIDDIEKRFSA